MDNKDFENENNNINENKKEVNNAENLQYSQESAENNSEIDSKEEKTASEQAEAAQEEIKADGEEGAYASEKAENDGVTAENKYSADYRPPYYVPNFTVTSQAENHKEKKPKEKKKYGLGVIAAMCAVCIVISAIVGAVSGAIASGAIELDISGTDGGTVNIVRSDREITVNEIPGNTGYADLTVAQVAALVSNTVVEITTTHVQTSSIYGQYITSGAGSGVIFSQQEGYFYIVTNYHVIEGADDVTITAKPVGSSVGKNYDAEYVSGDKAGDVAVLRVQVSGETFSTAVFGDSDKLLVGDEVVAIGNPLGSLGGTVTNGIISALGREITVEDNVMTLLQTNAAINPGNSGGGLFNMAGELIGIVNAKQSSTGIEGLGFAIPANTIVGNIKDILELGYVSGRPTLGISVQYGTAGGNEGVFVTDKGNTSFVKYDRIISIGGTTIKSLSDYNLAVSKLTIGSTVTVEVARTVGSGFLSQTHSVEATVYENKSNK